jgi:MFS superfamily sulfate permease-like transporter
LVVWAVAGFVTTLVIDAVLVVLVVNLYGRHVLSRGDSELMAEIGTILALLAGAILILIGMWRFDRIAKSEREPKDAGTSGR